MSHAAAVAKAPSNVRPDGDGRDTPRGRHGRLGRRTWALVLGALALAVALTAIATGAVPIRLAEIGTLLLRPLGWTGSTIVSPQAEAVFWNVRLPRVVIGLLIGAALSSSGAAMQGLFRNPLADPTLLGAASGAALGAVASLVLGEGLTHQVWAPFVVPAASFAGGLLATQLILRLSSLRGGGSTTMLLLSGIALNALLAAATGLFVFVANDAQLRSITFWSLGSLGGATWSVALGVAPFLLACVIGLPRCADALNLFLLGEAEAGHAGIAVPRARRRIVVLASLGIGASVAAAGTIGFLGLVVPHLVRMAWGPDHRRLLWASSLLGGSLLVAADLFARTMIAPAELPIGIVTALVGAPFFLWLLLRTPAGGAP